MATPKYVQRIARLPEVFALLATHPEGLALTELAARIGVPADELREDLLAFYTADPHDVLSGLSRPTVLEFFGADGDDVDPNQAELVRVVDERPADELGVEYLNASDLGLIYSAAKAQLELDPDDQDLHDALDVLTETMLGPSPEVEPVETRPPSDVEPTPHVKPTPDVEPNPDVEPVETPAPWNHPLETLEAAIESRRKVRIVYSRAWTEGVNERVIDPYLLVSTRRGWEVDAGPPDDQGRLRTYLLPHVRACEVLDEKYDAPADLADRLKQQRTTTRVRVQIPQAARWAADFYAEHVEVVDDDELATTLDLDLLPPIDRRVGLLLLIAGEDARVLQPAGLIAAGPALAAELLDHHCAPT